ncbi:MAG: hypothetical protein IKK75_16340 [Clostridia bacterium]|nr:hypothetical protein [Clostridia bacterium]
MKRMLALLLALVMMLGCAQAETIQTESIATYILPTGAEALHVWNTAVWDAPEGLEEMYGLMVTAEYQDDLYLARMKNGMALVSVSCMKPRMERTTEELLAMWPEIAQSIAREGVAVDADESCAVVETVFGHEALHIRTTIWLENEMELSAEGVAFFRGGELMEVWAVAPVEGSYAQDEQAAQQLASDRKDMVSFWQSLDFDDEGALTVNAQPFVDPDGRFLLAVPAGCAILNRHSAQEQIDQAREYYVAAHPEGADKLFDEYMKDITEQNVTVFISDDQQVVAEIFASREEAFAGMTADQLKLLAQPIRESLAERFDVAMLLDAEERAVVNGHEHAWLDYWLRSGETDVQLDVIAAVLDDAWLYEIDIYTHDGNQELRTLWYMYITQSILYTPLENALE